VAGLHAAAPGPLRPLVESESARGSSGVGVSTGAPGLLGVVRVSLP
jgi:hypothetical protein